jgi:ring-1,2-phenylacetyl-CoA epoxidase subunit PaaD
MRQEDHDEKRPNTDGEPGAAVAPDVICPFCGSTDVELISLFGGQLSTDQYYCRACRTYFEHFARDAEETR